MKSKIKCGNCEKSFVIDEKDLAETSNLECPECRQPFDEKFLEQLRGAFKSIHEYQDKK